MNAPVDGTLQTFAGTFKLSIETKMQAKKDGSQRVPVPTVRFAARRRGLHPVFIFRLGFLGKFGRELLSCLESLNL